MSEAFVRYNIVQLSLHIVERRSFSLLSKAYFVMEKKCFSFVITYFLLWDAMVNKEPLLSLSDGYKFYDLCNIIKIWLRKSIYVTAMPSVWTLHICVIRLNFVKFKMPPDVTSKLFKHKEIHLFSFVSMIYFQFWSFCVWNCKLLEYWNFRCILLNCISQSFMFSWARE